MTTIERLQKTALLMGKSICFHHDRTPRVLTRICEDGMVEVSGMSGQFAPHLFTVLGDRPFVPSGLTLQEWLSERLANTLRLAETKTGAEKEHWMEDGRYLDRAITLVNQVSEVANGETNTPVRMYIALKMLRAWALESFDGGVVVILKDWIDRGMKGPIPFPESPFFAEWASNNGLTNIDGSVGFMLRGELGEQ